MAIDAPITGAPTRAPVLSSLAATCLAILPDPDAIETIGRQFIEAADEMRAIGAKAVGHA